MHSCRYLVGLFIISCVIHRSMQQFPRRMKPEQLEGRIPELDDLVERHISDINTNDDGELEPVIAEARQIASKTVDKEMAQYYVDLLSEINVNGADHINDERDRLHAILESTKGAEYEHARLQNNIVEGIVDYAAEDVMKMMQSMNPGAMDGWEPIDFDNKMNFHDEV